MIEISLLWMIISILLVFLMIPGLAFFHGGFVRSNHSLSAILKSFITLGPIALMWPLIGHHIVFGSWDSFLGMTVFSMPIKETLDSLYFAMISLVAISILSGSIVERIHFNFWIAFSILWVCFVYYPVADWTISPQGWLRASGLVDYGGGVAVHICSGFSAVVLAKRLGRRLDFFKLRKSSNLSILWIGTTLIALGWMGFNGGSSLLFNRESLNAVINSLFSIFSGVTAWMILDLLFTPHKISGKGLSIAIISSLVAITPGAGLLTLGQSIGIAFVTVSLSYLGIKYFYKVIKIDDSCEVFVSHGLSGSIGLLLTAAFLEASGAISIAFLTIGVVFLYSVVITITLSFFLEKLIPFRVTADHEQRGLDITQHGEKVIVFAEED